MPQGDAGRAIASEVEAVVAAAHPELEIWDVAVVAREGKLRVLIDREGGVDLAACGWCSRGTTTTSQISRSGWAATTAASTSDAMGRPASPCGIDTSFVIGPRDEKNGPNGPSDGKVANTAGPGCAMGRRP